MKKQASRWISILVVLAILLTQNCSPDNPALSAADQVKVILTSGTWKIQSVDVDGTDQSNVYKGLSLNFTSTSYSATNGGAVWSPTDTWKFLDDTGKVIERGDGLEVNIEEATTATLVLKLTWNETTLGPGRSNSIAGVNVFTFGK